MARKRYSPEKIIGMLREAEVALAQGFGPIVLHVLFQERKDVVSFLDLSLFVCIPKIVNQLRGGFHADIVADERFLKLFQKVVIDISPQRQDRRQTRRNLLPSLAQMFL